MAQSKQQKLSDKLVRVMRNLPFPVTIVTTSDGQAMRGATIGSFTSLSLTPPLISFNVIRKTGLHDIISRAGRFVVHLPGYAQRDICTRFSIPDLNEEEMFQGLDYQRREGYPPVLNGMIAEIHCSVYHRFDAGDHTVVVGEVEDLVQHREESTVFYLNGNYLKVESD